MTARIRKLCLCALIVAAEAVCLVCLILAMWAALVMVAAMSDSLPK